jgi:hypothetical protein
MSPAAPPELRRWVAYEPSRNKSLADIVFAGLARGVVVSDLAIDDRTRTYRMGPVGNLEMTVPSNLQEVSKTLEKPEGVTLAYRLASRTDFYMKVTAIWISPEGRKFKQAGWVRRAVEKSARGIVGYSKTPTLTQIFSPGGSGYYFQSPGYDRLPIGEFHYITEGIVDFGAVTFVFTIYSNTKELPEIADSLRVVESARFVAG